MDPVHENCGTHRGHEIPEVRDIRRIVGGRELRGRVGKRVNGVSPGQPQSFRHQRRPVDDCSPRRGGIAQYGSTRVEIFMAEWIAAKKARAGVRHAVVCPNVTGRAKNSIAQSTRARAGSLAIFD